MAEYYLLLKAKFIRAITINEVRFIVNYPKKVSYITLMEVYQHPLSNFFYAKIKRRGQKEIYGKLCNLKKKKGNKYVRLDADY